MICIFQKSIIIMNKTSISEQVKDDNIDIK